MLRSIIVSGEASNVKYHSSGHVYFTMKDNSGALSCVCFASSARALGFRLTDGDKIESVGSINVYEKSGSYQLYVTDIKKAGAGELYIKYEALKKELLERGMFDAMYKQPIPKYAMRIGVVTAKTGAAVQDIMQIAKRRNPYVEIILYPAQVQGEGAKESIVAGIHALENQNVDVMIVGRGGGSIEDLWAFNEECVAEAIFNCSVPIVSAVGHETDTTIADLVADLRAPTPSAAAELTVFSYEQFIKDCEDREALLYGAISNAIDRKSNYVNQKQLRLNALSPQSKLQMKKMTYLNMLRQIDELMESKLDKSKNCLSLYIERMKGLSPLDRLEQGYAVVGNKDGKRVTSVKSVETGDSLNLTFRDGIINTKVIGKEVATFN